MGKMCADYWISAEKQMAMSDSDSIRVGNLILESQHSNLNTKKTRVESVDVEPKSNVNRMASLQNNVKKWVSRIQST